MECSSKGNRPILGKDERFLGDIMARSSAGMGHYPLMRERGILADQTHTGHHGPPSQAVVQGSLRMTTFPRRKAKDQPPVQQTWVLGQDSRRRSAMGHLPRPWEDAGVVGAPTSNQEAEGRGPAWEVVVARHSEDLTWLNQIPDLWQVVVYNKGGEEHPLQLLQPLPGCIGNYSVVDLPNKGREADTFATHVASRYDTLADYTVFSQGNPFVHNSHYLHLLEHPAMLSPVQVMSRVYVTDGDYVMANTPQETIDQASRHPWFRAERISLRTLDSLYFHDKGAIQISSYYRQVFNLTEGTNLIKNQLDRVGVRNWMEESQETGSFAYGAQIGVEQSRIRRHPREVYEMIAQDARENFISCYTIERTWLVLFGGSHFQDLVE